MNARSLGAVAAGLLPWAALGGPALRTDVGGARVDWEGGLVVATGGAAADIRMPGPDGARPGAERRGRSAAEAQLRKALSALPLGAGRTLPEADVERAVGRARASVDYQSDGGALVRLEVPFCAWREAAPEQPAATLSVTAMPLEAAPVLAVGVQSVEIGCARYRQGSAPAAAKPVRAHRDDRGRLVVPASLPDAGGLAGASVLIYVQAIEPARR